MKKEEERERGSQDESVEEAADKRPGKEGHLVLLLLRPSDPHQDVQARPCVCVMVLEVKTTPLLGPLVSSPWLHVRS